MPIYYRQNCPFQNTQPIREFSLTRTEVSYKKINNNHSCLTFGSGAYPCVISLFSTEFSRPAIPYNAPMQPFPH